MPEVKRIAVWSGPRNISTAMMRSWGNRPDTFVCDEPLYAHYLSVTGLDHPGAAEVIEHGETDWRKVASRLTGPVPNGASIFYQKHMAHHLLDGIGRDWLDQLTHVFLIRDPKEMLPSLVKKYPAAQLEDTGLPQQVEIAQSIESRTGKTPPIIDARDVLLDPSGMLRNLCDALGVVFYDSMLHWPPGRRETDGVWAKHWYDAVEQSTGFQPYVPKNAPIPDELVPICKECDRLYRKLFEKRLTA